MRITRFARRLLKNCDIEVNERDFVTRIFVYGLGLGIGVGLILLNYSPEIALHIGFVGFAVFELAVYGILLITANKRVAQIEDALPDFLTLMSSNIRSGLTPDRALLFSARKEFGPLTKEIDRAAKSIIIAGKPFTEAFMDMGQSIESEMFSKTLRLIVEGVRSGGNLAELLERTALDIRGFGATRKEVAATVLTYKLFMLAAAGLGAPLLYAVSSFLIQIISDMKEKIGVDGDQVAEYMPMFGGSSAVNPELILSFSITAIAITALFGSLAAGVVSKGKESAGFPYVPVMLCLAFMIFFASKAALEIILNQFFIA